MCNVIDVISGCLKPTALKSPSTKTLRFSELLGWRRGIPVWPDRGVMALKVVSWKTQAAPQVPQVAIPFYAGFLLNSSVTNQLWPSGKEEFVW